jgi:hypothetical protein
MVAQAVAWLLLSGVAIRDKLTKSEEATWQLRINRRNGYYAVVVYSLFAILAIWFPLIIAIGTVLLWIFWLIFGIRMKLES